MKIAAKKMLLRQPFVSFFFCLMVTRAAAQFSSPYNFNFQTFTTLDGLAHNFTRTCKADKKGFLWIATQNGLSRFDGLKFTNYLSDPLNPNSICGNNILDLDIDNKNRVWVALGNGVCFYDPITQRFIKIKGLENFHTINSVVADNRSKKIWVFTIEGIVGINTETLALSTTKLNTPFENVAYKMSLDSRGRLWIPIARGGYYMYHTRVDSFYHYNAEEWPINMYEDADKKIWISTWSSGFQQFDENTGTNITTTYDIIKNATYGHIFCGATVNPQLTGPDIIWVAHMATGISLFNKKEKRFVKTFHYKPETKSGISTEFNNGIYTAPDGTLWVCSWNGLEKVNRYNNQFQSAEIPDLNPQPANLYNMLAGMQNDPHDGDIIWMGVTGSGIAKYSRKKERVVATFFRDSRTKKDEYQHERWVNNLFTDSAETIWGCTYGGLVKIKNGIVNFARMSDDTGALYVQGKFAASDGKLWSASLHGLNWFNPYTGQKRYYKLAKPGGAPRFSIMFSAITEGQQQEKYVASWNGIYRFTEFEKDTIRINYLKSITQPDDFTIINALEYINNTLFIGTENGLLAYNILTKQTRQIAKDTIQTVVAGALKKDQTGNLWIYTANALYRYQPATNMLKKFTQTDGVYATSIDPVGFFEFDGWMYMGHRMAYTRFKPEAVDINEALAEPYITSVQNDTSFLPLFDGETAPYPLSYRHNNISFLFTAIEYNSPGKIVLEYILDGFDKSWQQSADRTAAYTNLPEGHYRLLVSATNSSGVKNSRMATYQFTIAAPWWRTWWFRAIVFIAVCLTLYVMANSWVRRIRKKEAQKTAVNKTMAELEMKTLRSRMNPHFIFNSLNSIQKFIWENKQDDASDYLSKFAKLMRLILDHSSHTAIPLADELDGLKLYMELEHRRCNGKFDYAIHVDENLNTDTIKVPPLILQPFVENAIWHGIGPLQNRTGILSVTIKKRDEKLFCEIYDNGIGRKKAAEIKAQSSISKSSVGIDITRQRLSQNSYQTAGNFTTKDLYTGDEPQGTLVIIQLPVIND